MGDFGAANDKRRGAELLAIATPHLTLTLIISSG
jgi:hypothetical protein